MGIDDSTANLSGITDGRQYYEECQCEVKTVFGASRRTGK